MESKELQRLILDLAVKRGSGKSFVHLKSYGPVILVMQKFPWISFVLAEPN